MCGRFSIYSSMQAIENRFNAKSVFKFPVYYNAAPGLNLPIIINPDQNKEILTKGIKNQIVSAKWGLIPHWSKEEKSAFKMINSRAETVSEKPSFKTYFKSQRCLIPANNFFEWKKTSKGKIPYLIKVKKEDLFSMAGIFSIWKDLSNKTNNKEIISFSIITTEPNKLTKKIHDRMPVVLSKGDEGKYLKEEDLEKVKKLLKPFDADRMEMFPVDMSEIYPWPA
ncbi:MAG: SOS response-associated peptidase [Candidatus Woesearchaeota archaeon]